MTDAPNILALDVSSRCTGVAEGRAGEVPRLYGISFARPHDDYADIFARALRWAADRFKVTRFDACYLEAPRSPGQFGDTNADTTLKLVGLWAVMSSAAKVRGIKYRSINVNDVRQGFLGSRSLPGAVAKAQAQAMCGRLGWNASDDNEADAAALWWHASMKEAPDLAPVITPLMHHEIATAVENARVVKFQEARERKLRRLRA